MEPELFNAVQAQLAQNSIGRNNHLSAGEPSLLAAILWDQHSRRMSPNHATKQTKRYRYCLSSGGREEASPDLAGAGSWWSAEFAASSAIPEPSMTRSSVEHPMPLPWREPSSRQACSRASSS